MSIEWKSLAWQLPDNEAKDSSTVPLHRTWAITCITQNNIATRTSASKSSKKLPSASSRSVRWRTTLSDVSRGENATPAVPLASASSALFLMRSFKPDRSQNIGVRGCRVADARVVGLHDQVCIRRTHTGMHARSAWVCAVAGQCSALPVHHLYSRGNRRSTPWAAMLSGCPSICLRV